jgi:hypothetical protein
LQTLSDRPENRSDDRAEDHNEPSSTGNTSKKLGFDLPCCPHEFSQGCCKHSVAVARKLGSNANIGVRKFENASASTKFQSYFSVRTSNKPHGFSLVMCLSSPATLNPNSNTAHRSTCNKSEMLLTELHIFNTMNI